MKKYYIYHIPNVKIGCSTNPNVRVKNQGYDYYEILETHTDINIVSNREIELQKEYGYTIDNTTYKQSYDWCRSGNAPIEPMLKAAKEWKLNNKDKHIEIAKLGGLAQGPIQGKKNAESGHISVLGKLNCSKIHTCPHCGKVGKSSSMFQWHFDKCKHKVVK
jgi:hypothetical protein